MSGECATCAHYEPPDWQDLGLCKLAEGTHNKPVHPDAPMWANGNDGYHSWLHVRPDFGCKAHTAGPVQEHP